jgi:hypothetical protein
MNDNLAEVEVEEEVELDQEETEEIELGEDGEPIEKAEIEPWMQEEDEEQDSSRMVPEAAIIKAKQKLKGRLADQKAESDTEIEKLRAEIEALKAGKVATPQATPTARPKRPREDDFDTDEAYDKAMDVYEDSLLQSYHERAEQTKTIKTTQAQAQEALTQSVDEHYTRAAKLQESKGIDPTIFSRADNTVRSAIEAIRPGQGDLLTDQLIQTLEEGSEMVMYNLGVNKSRRDALISALASDPSGLKAVAYVAGLKSDLTRNTKQRRSAAKKPASEVDGDIPPNAKAGALKRKYDAAHKKGGGQAAYNLKKEAKKMGVDVSSW